MSDFSVFREAVKKKFSKLGEVLFVTDVDREALWEAYLNSYPAEIRQEYNCNCCRSFIRHYGPIVAISENKLVSIWDVDVPAPFDEVAKVLKQLVLKSKIEDRFTSSERKLGTESNISAITGIKWTHFNAVNPSVFSSPSSARGEFRDNKNVFKRSLDEITIDSTDTVLELIEQNGLYRGQEFKAAITKFNEQQRKYALVPNNLRDNYAWDNSYNNPITRIRNTAIGTLLIDISNGVELDTAVSSFERIMAPSNYKRPTSVVTKKMIEEAEKTVNELGLLSSLDRRFAVAEDVNVNNLLFVNRNSVAPTDVFGVLKEDVPVSPKTLGKVSEVSLDEFIDNILPTSKEVEILFENDMTGNLVSLITAKDKESNSLFKWDNPFSWSYRGSVADSMKENVKKAGGKVDGALRFSIQWNDTEPDNSDLDAHCITPKGEIYFRERTNCGGKLDVDIINPIVGKPAVENITWDRIPSNGTYKFFVHCYASRGAGAFSAEIEFNGQIYEFSHPGLKQEQRIDVADVIVKDGNFSIVTKLPTSMATKRVWNLDTNKFHKVSMIMRSPNYWDKRIGNEHVFFMIDNAFNDESVRGFYNEFLKENLSDKRKVFEVLGSKLKVPSSNKQLSGLGFSSTQNRNFYCRVGGSFNRIIKVKI